MKALIYKPSRNTMQSGKAKTQDWVLEYELASAREPEPLMGWVSSEDTLNQVRMHFSSAEEAAAFAQEKGWEFTIAAEEKRRVKPRNYSDNFKYLPSEDK